MTDLIASWSSDDVCVFLPSTYPKMACDEDCNILTYDHFPIDAEAKILDVDSDVALSDVLEEEWSANRRIPECLVIRTSLREVINAEFDYNTATDGTISDESVPHFKKMLDALRTEADRLEKIINDGVWDKTA